jgi:zinc protease
MALSLPAGTAYDPPSQAGTADLLASLLTRGAGSRDADSVAAAIEQVGGSLSAAVDPDFLTLTADALSEHIDVAMGLLADAALRPHLDPQEVDKVRAQAPQAFRPTTLNREPGSRIFLPHFTVCIPRDQVHTVTLNNVGRRTLLPWPIPPSAAQLVIAGDHPGRCAQAATDAFGDWKGVAPALPVKFHWANRIIRCTCPCETSSILMGNTTAEETQPTTPPRWWTGCSVARRTAASFGSLRTSPPAESPASLVANQYMYQVGAEVRATVTDSAVREMLAQMRKIRTDTIAPEELQRAQAELTGGYPLGIQSMNQQAGAILKARRMGLPASSITNYRKQVASLSATRFRSAARTVVRPDSCLIVVVGNASQVYKGLSTIAPIAVIGPDGSALTPADLEPKTAALELDTTLLVPRKDSLLVVAQGRTVGVQVSTLERSGDGLLIPKRPTSGT